MADKLNDRQRQFVAEYLKDRNATQAAIRAGYSEKSAEEQGCRLLKDSQVAAAVAERTGKALNVIDADVTRIVTELAAIGFSDLTSVMIDTDQGPKLKPLSQWPPEIRRCISSIETSRKHIGIKTVKGDEPGEESLVEEAEIITKIKLWPKVQALAILAQYRKMVGWGGDPNAAPPAPFTGLTVIVAPGAAVQVNIGDKKP